VTVADSGSIPEPAPRANPMRGRIARPGDTPASWGNVANIITVVRILLTPLFVWLLFADAEQHGPLRYVAAAMFVVLIASDFVDGLLARRNNLVTDFGKIADPVADKGLVGSALVSLSILGELWWWVTIVILLREVGITVWRFVSLRDRVIPADTLGKVKTWAQAIAITALLLPLQDWLGEWYLWLGWVLIGIALLLTVASGAQYIVGAVRAGRTPAGPGSGDAADGARPGPAERP